MGFIITYSEQVASTPARNWDLARFDFNDLEAVR